MDITPVNIPKEVFKQFFSRHYEIKEQSIAQKLWDRFENLKTETVDEQAIRFAVKLLVENEVPGDLDNSVSMKANILIPAKATEMMNYLPNKLSTNFKQLWKYHGTRSSLPKKKNQINQIINGQSYTFNDI